MGVAGILERINVRNTEKHDDRVKAYNIKVEEYNAASKKWEEKQHNKDSPPAPTANWSIKDFLPCCGEASGEPDSRKQDSNTDNEEDEKPVKPSEPTKSTSRMKANFPVHPSKSLS